MKPRYSERRSVHATASFFTDEGVGYGCVEEISVPGCRLRTPALLEVGQTLNLEFRFAGQGAPLRVPLAVVRWVQSPFAGLEFIGMSWPDQARLRQLVRKHHTRPGACGPKAPAGLHIPVVSDGYEERD